MSNYDYRPELKEQEEGEKQLKEKARFIHMSSGVVYATIRHLDNGTLSRM